MSRCAAPNVGAGARSNPHSLEGDDSANVRRRGENGAEGRREMHSRAGSGKDDRGHRMTTWMSAQEGEDGDGDGDGNGDGDGDGDEDEDEGGRLR